MRVIAGTYRSRPLRSVDGIDIRPTSDRLRETLFNVLVAGNPSALEGTVWLDLFAGSGAVGIEAISRGAREVHFVENSPEAAGAIRKNLENLGIRTGFHLRREDVGRALARMTKEGVSADVIFLDPPYRMKDEYSRTLQALADSRILGPRSLVIAEHEKKFDPGERAGRLRRNRILAQGSAALSFYQPIDAGPTPAT